MKEKPIFTSEVKIGFIVQCLMFSRKDGKYV